jgi:uncharacterized membrane-anchored protein
MSFVGGAVVVGNVITQVTNAQYKLIADRNVLVYYYKYGVAQHLAANVAPLL